MKKILLLVLIGCSGLALSGQQIPTLTQYYFNHYSINPAATGHTDNLELAFSYRKIWAGITGSPSLQYLSGHMSIAQSMGAGIKFFNYTAGPLRKSGMELTYSYHVELNADVKLAFGLSGLLYQFYLDRTELAFEDPSDDVLMAGQDKMIVPDANFGMYLYSDNYYIGLSAPQLIGRNIDLKSDKIIQEKQVRHYYLFGGYNYHINRDFSLKPSLLLKFIEAGLFQVDVNAIVEYKQTFVGGISFRSSDAVIFQVGFKYAELLFGYSYDLPIAGVRGSTFGSHEVFISYSIPNFIK